MTCLITLTYYSNIVLPKYLIRSISSQKYFAFATVTVARCII